MEKPCWNFNNLLVSDLININVINKDDAIYSYFPALKRKVLLNHEMKHLFQLMLNFFI